MTDRNWKEILCTMRNNHLPENAELKKNPHPDYDSVFSVYSQAHYNEIMEQIGSDIYDRIKVKLVNQK